MDLNPTHERKRLKLRRHENKYDHDNQNERDFYLNLKNKPIKLDVYYERLEMAKERHITKEIQLNILTALVKKLIIYIQGAQNISLITSGIKTVELETRMIQVTDATKATLCILFILTSSEIDINLYREDFIECVISFVKFQVITNIVPYFKGNTFKDVKISNEDIVTLYKLYTKSIGLFGELLHFIKMPEVLIFDLVKLCLATMHMTNIRELTVNCVNLIQKIVTKNEKYRNQIQNDILMPFVQISTDKIKLQIYPLENENGKTIHIVTALVLQFVQSAATTDAEQHVTKDKLCKTTDTCIALILKSDVTSPTKVENFVYISQTIINELLDLVNMPEWPAAEFLLITFGKYFSNIVQNVTGLKIIRKTCLKNLTLICVFLYRKTKIPKELNVEIDCIIVNLKANNCIDNNMDKEKNFVVLQKILINYLATKGNVHAQNFYSIRWDLAGSANTSSSNTSNNNKNNNDNLNSSNVGKKSNTLKSILPRKRKRSEKNINCRNITITDSEANVIVQYLTFNYCAVYKEQFDECFKTITMMLVDRVVEIREEAIKSLSIITETDLTLLQEDRLEKSIKRLICDMSAKVREKIVNFIFTNVSGKFELLKKYFNSFIDRISDININVRKRVLETLIVIYSRYPDFEQLPDIRKKILLRVNDEDYISEMVVQFFFKQWFRAIDRYESTNIKQIDDVVNEIIEQLSLFENHVEKLLQLIFNANDSVDKKILHSSAEKLITYAVKKLDSNEDRLEFYVIILKLFAKVQPNLLVEHFPVLQNKLDHKNNKIVDNVINSLSHILPIVVKNADIDNYLNEIEMKLIKMTSMCQQRSVLNSCVTCLNVIVNDITKKYRRITETLKIYSMSLNKYQTYLSSENQYSSTDMHKLIRVIICIGLFLKYFDFTKPEVNDGLPVNITEKLLNMLMQLLPLVDDVIATNIFLAIGFICSRHNNFMLEKKVIKAYNDILCGTNSMQDHKHIILQNIKKYLQEEENRSNKSEHNDNCLKKIDEGGMANIIIQEYLKGILLCYMHQSSTVRQNVFDVISLILRHGSVQPIKILPYLIAMSTDPVTLIARGANKCLNDVKVKCPGELYSQIHPGVAMSFKLQQILRPDNAIRGIRTYRETDFPEALMGYIYELLDNNQTHKRLLIKYMLDQFNCEVDQSVNYLIYLADNFAYFPYIKLDDLLYTIYSIDLKLAEYGPNMLENIKKCFTKQIKVEKYSDSEIETIDELMECLPSNVQILTDQINKSIGCYLLIQVKKFLKFIYNIPKSLMSEYNPNNKTSGKLALRCQHDLFNPKPIINNPVGREINEDMKTEMIRFYLYFKKEMLYVETKFDSVNKRKKSSN